MNRQLDEREGDDNSLGPDPLRMCQRCGVPHPTLPDDVAKALAEWQPYVPPRPDEEEGE
jgi:hypothetical protein